jgi:hypothetical protein
MSSIEQFVHTLTDAQKANLQALLGNAPAEPAAEVQKPSYYNMDDAVPVKFRAVLAAVEKARDQSYAQRFDHVWCVGHYQVKGPKGGVYFVGRCVLGVKKGQQLKGTLRVGNRHFEALLNGGTMDAWFRPDGEDEAVLIGVLSDYREA